MQKLLFSIIIGYVTIAQGAFFLAPLIILNVFFVISIAGKNSLKLDVIALIFTLIFTIMAISWAFSLSPHDGFLEIQKYSLFPLSYIYFCNCDELENAESAFYKAFAILMIFGMLGMAGFSPLPNMTTNLGGRLQSFLGYANTTALIMGIGVFYATQKAAKDKRQIAVALLFFVAMIFTLSRVAFITFIASYSLYIFRFIAWRAKAIAVATIAVIWAILAIFDSRIVNISLFAPTLVERYISYADAFMLMLQNPFGIGLSNWQFLQFYHQSAPYNVKFIHNFYLQLGLDGGFLALLLMLVAFSIAFVKRKKDDNYYIYIAIFILSSAFFEVHFNFGLIIVYFMYVLAKLVESKSVFELELHKIIKFAIAVPVVAILLLFFTANALYNTATQNESNGNWSAAYDGFIVAEDINPLSDGKTHFAKARTAPYQDLSFAHLKMAFELNPWDTNVIFALVERHANIGDMQTANEYANILLEKHRFSRRNQEIAMEIAESLGTIYVEQLDQQIAHINAEINQLFRYIDPNFRY